MDLESDEPLERNWRTAPDEMAAEFGLPPLPSIDTKNSIPYSAIRYVSGYTENFCKNYALQYARAVLKQRARMNFEMRAAKILSEAFKSKE